ncbi:MAG: 16S rRNA (cytosine(1402)-N(4))-methyltransferase RsmH [Chloroflexota bacterium]
MSQLSKNIQHQPVLYHQVLEYLAVAPGKDYLDGTLGAAGHASGILDSTHPSGRLLGMDRDPKAIQTSLQRLAPYSERITLVNDNFAAMSQAAHDNGFSQFDGILLDLGLSSPQLLGESRGFSFRYQAPLDMRMDQRQELTAEIIVNEASVEELEEILLTFGEEPRARRIAQAIVKQRPITNTAQLAELVTSVVGRRSRKRRLHPATLTFQALRIAVNDELGKLQKALPQTLELLRPGGRLVIISFHSLEDRIVKNFIRRESQDCICPPDVPICACDHQATLNNLTRKPVRPSKAEEESNPRSRSARLRAAERL